jgi:hypothetical protein
MKDRLAKLKAKRGKIDMDFQICKKCSKDYKESENFNWSCRTHKSAWSGEMWWCCGKKSKEAQGCLFSKHEVKKDEDDEEKAADEDLLNRRCMCCKDKGHGIEECPRDPNLKTGHNMQEEVERIGKRKDVRTLVGETMP